MTINPAQLESIVEDITRQVLLRLSTQSTSTGESGLACSKECHDGLCVQVCVEKVRSVVNAGADRITAGLGAVPADKQVAALIDHTLLKADATPDQIAQLCYEARKHSFASVCVNPTHVKLAAQLLAGSRVLVCTVIGFPLGANSPEVKAFEAQQAIDNGATEIDMVINIGAIKANDYPAAARDVRSVVRVCHAHNVIVKVILETALLTDDEKIAASLIAKEAGADFVKTSTGFGPGGATVEDVALMRRVVGPNIGVKASGGVRNYQDAQAMVAAGATRIGASAGIRIVKEAQGQAPATNGSSKGY